MICPVCHFEDTKVTDSRVIQDGMAIRRRRECLKCGFRFSTFEEIVILDLQVIKRNGQKEAYDREKLLKGLKKALEKRAVSDDDVKKLVNKIERDIQVLKKSEIPTDKIGEIIMKHLRKFDPVAYIRFASVYESFEDLQTFQEELDKLLKNKKNNKK